jgi:hypothetical protein
MLKKASTEMIYGIPHFTRGGFGAGSLRPDYCWLSMLRSAARAADVLLKITAF